MAQYAYIRVSSTDQKEDRQLAAINSLRIDKKNIFLDKQSGKDFNRPQYIRMCSRIKEGDVLYIKSIDRLGRNYEEIQEQWRVITKIKKADIVVLDMPLLDTRRGKDLIGTFLSDVVLQVLSFCAENERNYIRQRQREGIEAAKKKGVQFGRPPVTLPDNFEQVRDKWLKNEICTLYAAQQCNMAKTTFYRYAQKNAR
jgi:DNA invertase Pin-like site-specific DNA recombinase